MSFKQFPVQFKGYHNGDGGLIYPNSSTMLNCRLNHHDAVEQILGYGNFITGLSSYVTGYDVAYLIGMAEYNYYDSSSYVSQGQVSFVQGSSSGPNRWGLNAVKTIGGTHFNMGGIASNLGISFWGSVNTAYFLDNLLAMYSIPYAGAGIYTTDATLSADYFHSLSVCSLTPSFGTPHYNRLFVAGDWSNKSTLNWSDVDTLHTWPVANTLNVNTDDGDYITAIQSYKGDLYVFKSRTVYKIVGDNFNPTSGNYTVVKLEGIPGCTNQKAVTTANGNMFWVSQQYIVEYNGSSFKYIDYPFLIDDRAGMSYNVITDIDPFFLQHNEKEHEILFFRRATATWYGYDYLQEQWSKVNLSSTSLSFEGVLQHLDNSTGKNSLAFFSNSGKSFLFGDYNSFLNSVGSAIAINSYYETDWMDMGSWLRKEAPRIYIDTKQDGFLSAHPYSLSCSVYFDYDPVAYDSVVFACNGNTNQLHEFYPEVQTFRRIKLRFANNVLDTKMQVNRAVIEYDLIDESGRIG